jgi:hypothetical protein
VLRRTRGQDYDIKGELAEMLTVAEESAAQKAGGWADLKTGVPQPGDRVSVPGIEEPPREGW